MRPSAVSDGDFFGFNPVPTRIALGIGGAICALLAFTGGLRPALAGGGAPAWALFAGYVLMTLLFVAAAYRLRPRAGWGITLGRRVLTVSRPLFGAAFETEFSDLGVPRRTPNGVLVLTPSDGSGELHLSRHLFPSGAAFARMAEALEERLPRPRYDA